MYGLITDPEGRPISVDVYPGNTTDSTTVPGQVEKLRHRYGLSHVVFVGDRGMLTQTKIDILKKHPGTGWISALTSKSIQQLPAQKHLQLSLFDTQNLAEISSPDYPGERLIARFNLMPATERNRKRLDLLGATEKLLENIAKQVARRTKTPLKKAEIGVKVGKIINKYKVGKHFNINIQDSFLHWERKTEMIEREASLDGIYVIRTSEPKEKMSAENTVRNYKSLALVERAFRSLKGVDILIRPIRHRLSKRVKAHIFICMLAYYVEWHMRIALAPLLFEDEELDENRKTRDPVAQAKPSKSAKKKKKVRKTNEGFPIHSFDTLITELGTRCRNLCKLKSSPETPPFVQNTEFS